MILPILEGKIAASEALDRVILPSPELECLPEEAEENKADYLLRWATMTGRATLAMTFLAFCFAMVTPNKSVPNLVSSSLFFSSFAVCWFSYFVAPACVKKYSQSREDNNNREASASSSLTAPLLTSAANKFTLFGQQSVHAAPASVMQDGAQNDTRAHAFC